MQKKQWVLAEKPYYLYVYKDGVGFVGGGGGG